MSNHAVCIREQAERVNVYADDPMILELIALLKAHGVLHLVISPGSRHYPIVRSLEADSDFHLYSVVDERSAAFFAIGVIRASDAPVAVLTTSGTAAVNLSSAVADAYYQRLPLVVITADRLPQLLDQMEDQMINQLNLFEDYIRARALLRPIRGDIDHWYDNRVINEALLALRTNGAGPVHINVPIVTHTGLAYTTSSLPAARVISQHSPTLWGTDWSGVQERLRGRRILLLWGQSNPPSKGLLDALDHFTSMTDSIVIADHLGNLHQAAALPHAFPTVRSGRARGGALTPDIVVTVGGTLFLIEEIKALLDSREVEHWRVDPDGKVMDPFWQLTDVFQVSPEDFFRNAAPDEPLPPATPYRTESFATAEIVKRVPERFGEMGTIGALFSRIPHGSALHIGNSAPMRMAHLYDLDESITVLGNRGVNGIDGSMSSTIGYAAVSGQLTFLVIGDLSFFYDMNSLWIRHRPETLRVLVLNNGGGALMHSPVPLQFADQASQHTSAGHGQSVRGWVESLGIRYASASDADELAIGLDAFTSPETGAMVLEVFTDKAEDMKQLKDYHSANAASGGSTYRKVRSLAGRTLRKLGVRG